MPVKSAVRVVDMIEAVAGSLEGLGISDLARRLAIPKSSASNIGATLLSRRFLERTATGRLVLGDRLFDILRAARGQPPSAAEGAGRRATEWCRVQFRRARGGCIRHLCSHSFGIRAGDRGAGACWAYVPAACTPSRAGAAGEGHGGPNLLGSR